MTERSDRIHRYRDYLIGSSPTFKFDQLRDALRIKHFRFLHLIKRLREYLGYDKYSAETFDRLIHSRHVKDLRWIVDVTVFFAALALIAFGLLRLSVHTDVAFLPFTIILGALGTVLAWCYQTGSSRLGMIDLFACEITTLCRVCNVIGLAATCIAAFEFDHSEQSPSDQDKIMKMRDRFMQFELSEVYTPIFDANAKELQSF